MVSRRNVTGSVTTFYTFDERGNVAQRTTSTGMVASTDLYDSYGSRTGTVSQPDPFGFEAQDGYYTDTETGLLLCTHRFYDPSTGRWLTRDPIGYDGGINLYGYTGNNPANESDPDGTFFGVDDAAEAYAAFRLLLAAIAAAEAAAQWARNHPIGPIYWNPPWSHPLPPVIAVPPTPPVPTPYRRYNPKSGKPNYNQVDHYPTGPHYDPDPSKHKGGPHWDYPDPHNPGHNNSFPADGHPLCPTDPNDPGPQLS